MMVDSADNAWYIMKKFNIRQMLWRNYASGKPAESRWLVQTGGETFAEAVRSSCAEDLYFSRRKRRKPLRFLVARPI